jgi:hypothetical protein
VSSLGAARPRYLERHRRPFAAALLADFGAEVVKAELLVAVRCGLPHKKASFAGRR